MVPPANISSLIPVDHAGIVHRYDNIPTSIANGWRRTMLDNIRYPRLNATDMTNIITDDPVNQRLTDDIQNQLKTTPNSYLEFMEDPGFEAEISIENTSDNSIVVTTDDIKVTKCGSIPRSFKWEKTTRLCMLKAGCSIMIPIKIDWGYSREHVSFGQFGPIRYKPYKIDTSVGNASLPPSYSVVPMNYELGLLQCHNYITPLAAVKLGWETLKNIIESAQESLLDVGDSKFPYISGSLRIVKSPPNEIHFYFADHCETLGEILAWYAFQNKSVSFIVAGKTAPYAEEVRIKMVLDDVDATIEDYVDALMLAGDDAIAVITEITGKL
ncbi:MAG: hypothetical protein P1U70_25405 [Saprospiraceae bacterium]|nr:hypothetical protein [Saprospiraceae bacterium]